MLRKAQKTTTKAPKGLGRLPQEKKLMGLKSVASGGNKDPIRMTGEGKKTSRGFASLSHQDRIKDWDTFTRLGEPQLLSGGLSQAFPGN